MSAEAAPETAGMAEPYKCEECGTWYDEASGDGYCGLCPSCADKEHDEDEEEYDHSRAKEDARNEALDEDED